MNDLLAKTLRENKLDPDSFTPSKAGDGILVGEIPAVVNPGQHHWAIHHHAGLIPGQDSRFAELGPALAAFYNATVELGIASSVTTFTASEFGRTFNPSSTDGADHAWGSHHMIMGGGVKGGEMYGTFPSLELKGPDDAADRGTWIPTTSLDQYGATLASWFGVPDASLTTVFPNLANFQSGAGNGLLGLV